MSVPFRLRTAATLTAALLALAACGESESLPTTFEPDELEADVLAAEAAFSDDATTSLIDLGLLIDDAILAAGGVAVTAQASLVLDGAVDVTGKLAPSMHLVERARSIANEDMAAAIPIALLGRTLEWNTTSDQYVVTQRQGAPATGVRFILYAVAPTGMPAEPLIERGYVDIVREASGNTVLGRVTVVNMAGTTVMQYQATVSGTQNAPSFNVTGFAGVGANQLTFELTAGVNLINQSLTVTWVTEIPARGLRSSVQLGIGETSFNLAGELRNGTRRIQLIGTINFETGGVFTIRVGGRVFATMTFDTMGGSSIVNADGQPLTPEQEDALYAVLDWFEAAFFVPDALLAPLYTVLDVD